MGCSRAVQTRDSASHAGCELAFRTDMLDGVQISYGRESIKSVQKFAWALESLLRIGIEMSLDRRGSPDDWHNADRIISGPDFLSLVVKPWEFDIQSARNFFQILISRLIEICRIRPRFFWNQKT